MYNYRKGIILFWILFIALTSFYAFKLPSILTGSGFEMEGSYQKTETVLKEVFNQETDLYVLLFENKNEEKKQDYHAYIEDVLNPIIDSEKVKMVRSPLDFQEQQKGDYAFAIVSFEDNQDVGSNIAFLEENIKKTPSIEVTLTGEPIIEEEINVSSQKDLKNAELIGLPIALLVLLLSFRGLVSAFIPLVTGSLSVLSAMGIVYFVGQQVNLSVFVLNVVPMIGLALSIDFALLYINRFRDEIERHEVKKAIAITNRTAGRSILFSGLCVVLGLSGMLFIKVDIFKSIAIGGIIVVIASVLIALSFLPALLAIIGHRINALTLWKAKEGKEDKWERFAIFVMKRPIVMTVFALVILGIGLFPIKDIQLEIPDASALPSHNEARTAIETYERVFVPENEVKVPIVVNIGNDKDKLEKLKIFESEVEEEPKIIKVDSIFSVMQKDEQEINRMLENEETKKLIKPIYEQFIAGEYGLIYLYIKGDETSKETRDWLESFEERDFSLGFTMGGFSKMNQEVFSEIENQSLKGLALIIISTFIMIMFAFRSILIPLKAIFMNLLSFGAAFGIVVWVFQNGHFGIEPSAIGLMIPVIAFAIVFGLSMDYEVFLISRIEESYRESLDNDKAVLEGLTKTSKIITSAAAIMIVITGAFSFTDIIPVKQIGIGVALSIFIDATIIRMILVPSLMKLFGRWNWWFPFKNKKKKQ